VSTNGPEYFASCFLELLDGGLGPCSSGAGRGTASKEPPEELMPMPLASGRSPATKTSSSFRKDTDPDIPIYRLAEAEYARRQC
jgi:hypothetical protein